MTAFWLQIFVSAEPNQTTLSIDRPQPKFKNHAEGKIRKTLTFCCFFVNFRLNQIQNCSVQIKKMKKKTTSAEHYQTMLDT